MYLVRGQEQLKTINGEKPLDVTMPYYEFPQFRSAEFNFSYVFELDINFIKKQDQQMMRYLYVYFELYALD